MIEIIYFSTSMCAVLLSILGYGSLFIKKINKNDLFFLSLVGYFSYGLLALTFHFFFPVYDIFGLIIIILGLIIFIIKLESFQNLNILKKLAIYVFFCFILLGFSEHPIDANMYHHPYVSYLNSEKIIFGIAQVQFRFGHVSFLQYTQAITGNKFLHDLTIASPNLIIYCFFLFYCADIILKNYKKRILFILTILINSFILIKLSRYREFGNDLIPFILASYLLINVIKEKFYKEYNKINTINFFPLYSILIFSHKISYIFTSLTFLAIFKKEDIIKIIKNKFTLIIFFFFLFSWIAKNIITTSCLAYPLVISCIQNTSWYLTGMADPKNASWLTELWSKDFITMENWKSLDLNQYINTFQWVPNWLNNHFLKILEKMSPIFIICLIISVYIIAKKNNLKKKISIPNNKFFLLLMLIFIGLAIWFLKAPVFRYGSFYIVAFVSILFIFLIKNQIYSVDIVNFKKLKIIFMISIFFLISKNLIRQVKSEENFFALTKPNISEYYNIGKNNLKILKPRTIGVCYYSGSICSHEVKKSDNFEKFNGYFFLIKNK